MCPCVSAKLFSLPAFLISFVKVACYRTGSLAAFNPS